MLNNAPAASVDVETVTSRQRRLTVLGCLLALLLAALDQTIVGTAMPRIVAELHGFEHYAWVTTAYLLTSTAVVPIVGKLSDMYGRKYFLMGSAAGFVLASMLCGLAQDMTQLIVFRGLQGLAGGTLMATVFTVISVIYPPAERGRIQGVFAGLFGFSSVVGPLLGGYLTDSLSWRWVFYVNLPVGVVVLVLLWLAFPDRRAAPTRHQIDFAGAATLMLGVTPLLLALSWGGRDYAWSSPQVLGLLTLAATMTALFVWIEMRAAEPIIPLALFCNSIVTLSTLALALMAMGMFGTILFVPLFAQGVLGQSATESGTVLMPMTLAMVVTSIIGGQIVSRTGRYRAVALAGLAVAVLGLFLLGQVGPETQYPTLVRDTFILGLGLGLVMPLFTLIAQNAVDLSQIGVVTALSQFARSIGGTLGAAVFGWLLVTRFTAALADTMPDSVRAEVPPAVLADLANPLAVLNPLAAEVTAARFAPLSAAGQPTYHLVTEAVRVALAGALHDTFLAGAAILAVALGCTLFLREVPLQRARRFDAPPAQHPQAAVLSSDAAPGGSPHAAGPSASRPMPRRAERG
jgi:EmrB/QacA subfamily drug resistance transporter